MINTIQISLPYLILSSHALFLALFLALIFRKTWGGEVSGFFGKHATLLGFIISLLALIGSLFYSEVVGFEVCILCWWQRVFLYPLVIIFGIALWKKREDSFIYAVPLSALAGIIALYHTYANLGGTSLLPCTAEGAACSKLFVLSFGYITIPTMSVTIAAYILLIAWTQYVYRRN